MDTFRMKHQKHGTCIADEVAEPQLLELGWVREGAELPKGTTSAQAPASPAGGKKDKSAQAPASPASPAAAGGSEDLSLEDLG